MRACAALALFLGLAASAMADVEQGVEAWKQGDFRAALEQFRPAAEQGDARAQFYLAEAFNLGRGTVQDYAEALKWYVKAADGGNIDAQDKLCTAYFFGENIIRKDEALAVKMCAGAAQAGRVYAAFLAGYLYDFGKGVTADRRARRAVLQDRGRRRERRRAGSAGAHVLLRSGRGPGLRGSGQVEREGCGGGPALR